MSKTLFISPLHPQDTFRRITFSSITFPTWQSLTYPDQNILHPLQIPHHPLQSKAISFKIGIPLMTDDPNKNYSQEELIEKLAEQQESKNIRWVRVGKDENDKPIYARHPAADTGPAPVTPRSLAAVDLTRYPSIPMHEFHPEWNTDQRKKLNKANQWIEAVSRIQYGVSPIHAALGMPEVQQAIKKGTVNVQHLAKLDELAEQRKYETIDKKEYEKSVEALKKDHLAELQGKSGVNHSTLPTRAAYIESYHAAQPERDALVRAIAIRAGQKTDEVQKRLAGFSHEQLAIINSTAPVTTTNSGAGSGKSTTLAVAALNYALRNPSANLSVWLDKTNAQGEAFQVRNRRAAILTPTHAANYAIMEKFEQLQDLFPGMAGKTFSAVTPYSRAMSDINSKLVKKIDADSGQVDYVTPKHAFGMGNYTLMGVPKNRNDEDYSSHEGWLGDMDANSRDSQLSFIADILKEYKVKGLSASTAMQYINTLKQDTISLDGSTRWKAVKEEGESQLQTDPFQQKNAGALPERMLPAIAALYEKRRHQEKKYDLEDALELGYRAYTDKRTKDSMSQHQIMFGVLDEVQGFTPNQLAFTAAATHIKAKVFAGGDLSQKIIHNQLDQFELLERAMTNKLGGDTSKVQRVDLTGNFRSDQPTVSFMNQRLGSALLNNYPKAPFQVSVSDMNNQQGIGIMPRHLYRRRVQDVHMQAIKGWMEQVGITTKHMAENMKKGQHPLTGSTNSPMQSPFIFPVEKHRDAFLEHLQGYLTKELGEESGPKAFQQIAYAPKEGWSKKNHNQLFALKQSQAQGHGFQNPWVPGTPMGTPWTPQERALNRYIMESRTQGGQLTVLHYGEDTPYSKGLQGTPMRDPITGQEVGHSVLPDTMMLLQNLTTQQGVHPEMLDEYYQALLQQIGGQAVNIDPTSVTVAENDPKAMGVIEQLSNLGVNAKMWGEFPDAGAGGIISSESIHVGENGELELDDSNQSFKGYRSQLGLAGKPNLGPDPARLDLVRSFIHHIARSGPDSLTQLSDRQATFSQQMQQQLQEASDENLKKNPYQDMIPLRPGMQPWRDTTLGVGTIQSVWNALLPQKGTSKRGELPDFTEMLDPKSRWFTSMNEMVNGQRIGDIPDEDLENALGASSVINDAGREMVATGGNYRHELDSDSGLLAQKNKQFDKTMQAKLSIDKIQSMKRSIGARARFAYRQGDKNRYEGFLSQVQMYQRKKEEAILFHQQQQQKLADIERQVTEARQRPGAGISFKEQVISDETDKFRDMAERFEYVDTDDEQPDDVTHRRKVSAMLTLLKKGAAAHRELVGSSIHPLGATGATGPIQITPEMLDAFKNETDPIKQMHMVRMLRQNRLIRRWHDQEQRFIGQREERNRFDPDDESKQSLIRSFMTTHGRKNKFGAEMLNEFASHPSVIANIQKYTIKQKMGDFFSGINMQDEKSVRAQVVNYLDNARGSKKLQQIIQKSMSKVFVSDISKNDQKVFDVIDVARDLMRQPKTLHPVRQHIGTFLSQLAGHVGFDIPGIEYDEEGEPIESASIPTLSSLAHLYQRDPLQAAHTASLLRKEKLSPEARQGLIDTLEEKGLKPRQEQIARMQLALNVGSLHTNVKGAGKGINQYAHNPFHELEYIGSMLKAEQVGRDKNDPRIEAFRQKLNVPQSLTNASYMIGKVAGIFNALNNPGDEGGQSGLTDLAAGHYVKNALGMEEFQSEPGVATIDQMYKRYADLLDGTQGGNEESRAVFEQTLSELDWLKGVSNNHEQHVDMGNWLSQVGTIAMNQDLIDSNGEPDEAHQKAISQLFSPWSGSFGEERRSLPNMLNLAQALQEGSEYTQRTGNLKRGHIDAVLTALGHDPAHQMFAGLRGFEAMKDKPFDQPESEMSLMEAAYRLSGTIKPNSPDKEVEIIKKRRSALLKQFSPSLFAEGQQVQFSGSARGRHQEGLQAGTAGILKPFPMVPMKTLEKHAKAGTTISSTSSIGMLPFGAGADRGTLAGQRGDWDYWQLLSHDQERLAGTYFKADAGVPYMFETADGKQYPVLADQLQPMESVLDKIGGGTHSMTQVGKKGEGSNDAALPPPSLPSRRVLRRKKDNTPHFAEGGVGTNAGHYQGFIDHDAYYRDSGDVVYDAQATDRKNISDARLQRALQKMQGKAPKEEEVQRLSMPAAYTQRTPQEHQALVQRQSLPSRTGNYARLWMKAAQKTPKAFLHYVRRQVQNNQVQREEAIRQKNKVMQRGARRERAISFRAFGNRNPESLSEWAQANGVPEIKAGIRLDQYRDAMARKPEQHAYLKDLLALPKQEQASKDIPLLLPQQAESRQQAQSLPSFEPSSVSVDAGIVTPPPASIPSPTSSKQELIPLTATPHSKGSSWSQDFEPPTLVKLDNSTTVHNATLDTAEFVHVPFEPLPYSFKWIRDPFIQEHIAKYGFEQENFQRARMQREDVHLGDDELFDTVLHGRWETVDEYHQRLQKNIADFDFTPSANFIRRENVPFEHEDELEQSKRDRLFQNALGDGLGEFHNYREQHHALGLPIPEWPEELQPYLKEITNPALREKLRLDPQKSTSLPQQESLHETRPLLAIHPNQSILEQSPYREMLVKYKRHLKHSAKDLQDFHLQPFEEPMSYLRKQEDVIQRGFNERVRRKDDLTFITEPEIRSRKLREWAEEAQAYTHAQENPELLQAMQDLYQAHAPQPAHQPPPPPPPPAPPFVQPEVLGPPRSANGLLLSKPLSQEEVAARQQRHEWEQNKPLAQQQIRENTPPIQEDALVQQQSPVDRPTVPLAALRPDRRQTDKQIHDVNLASYRDYLHWQKRLGRSDSDEPLAYLQSLEDMGQEVFQKYTANPQMDPQQRSHLLRREAGHSDTYRRAQELPHLLAAMQQLYEHHIGSSTASLSATITSPPPPSPPPTQSTLPQVTPTAIAEPDLELSPLKQLDTVRGWIRHGSPHAKKDGLFPPLPEQRAVMESDAFHKIIQGGPGVGKTHTLVRSVMDTLAQGKHGIGSDEVLMLSAMHSGVGALNQEMENYKSDKMLPTNMRTLQVPKAGTLHSLAYQIMAKGHTTDEDTSADYYPAMASVGRKFNGTVLVEPDSDELRLIRDEHESAQGLDPKKFLRDALTNHGYKGDTSDATLGSFIKETLNKVKANRLVQDQPMPDGSMKSHYDVMRAQGMLDLGNGNYESDESKLALYEHTAEKEGFADFNDFLHYGQKILQKGTDEGYNPLPSSLQRKKLIGFDEAQDLTVGAHGLLEAAMPHMNDPRLYVGMDLMQTIIDEGIGGVGPRNIMNKLYGLMRGRTVKQQDLNVNMRSDQEAVALHNAILQHPALVDHPKAPIQKAHSKVIGKRTSYTAAGSQPELYRKMWSSMFGLAGVTPKQLVENFQKHGHALHGIDWKTGKEDDPYLSGDAIRPGEMPAMVMSNKQLDLLENELRNKIHYEGEIGVHRNSKVVTQIMDQIYRRGQPGRRAPEEIKEAAKEKKLFIGTKVAGMRSLSALYPHFDTTIVGKWLSDWSEKTIKQSYLRNFLIGATRVKQGGQNRFFHTDKPFYNKQADQYIKMGPEHFLTDGNDARLVFSDKSEKAIAPSPENKLVDYNGQKVPTILKSIFEGKDAQLADWLTPPARVPQAPSKPDLPSVPVAHVITSPPPPPPSSTPPPSPLAPPVSQGIPDTKSQIFDTAQLKAVIKSTPVRGNLVSTPYPTVRRIDPQDMQQRAQEGLLQPVGFVPHPTEPYKFITALKETLPFTHDEDEQRTRPFPLWDRPDPSDPPKGNKHIDEQGYTRDGYPLSLQFLPEDIFSYHTNNPVKAEHIRKGIAQYNETIKGDREAYRLQWNKDHPGKKLSYQIRHNYPTTPTATEAIGARIILQQLQASEPTIPLANGTYRSIYQQPRNQSTIYHNPGLQRFELEDERFTNPSLPAVSIASPPPSQTPMVHSPNLQRFELDDDTVPHVAAPPSPPASTLPPVPTAPKPQRLAYSFTDEDKALAVQHLQTALADNKKGSPWLQEQSYHAYKQKFPFEQQPENPDEAWGQFRADRHEAMLAHLANKHGKPFLDEKLDLQGKEKGLMVSHLRFSTSEIDSEDHPYFGKDMPLQTQAQVLGRDGQKQQAASIQQANTVNIEGASGGAPQVTIQQANIVQVGTPIKGQIPNGPAGYVMSSGGSSSSSSGTQRVSSSGGVGGGGALPPAINKKDAGGDGSAGKKPASTASRYNNEESQLGRTLARIGGELQFVGQSMTQWSDQQVKQASDYRKATLALGTNVSGKQGTSGFFNFSQAINGMDDGNDGYSIRAYEHDKLPMYSMTQIAQGIQAMTSQTRTPFNTNQLGSLTDVMSLANLAGVDPQQLMPSMLSAGSAMSGAYGGSGNTTIQNTKQLTGMLYQLYNGNLSSSNVQPTMDALNSILPTLQGMNPYGGSQAGQAMAFFQTALNAGIPAGNLGNVSSSLGTIAQAGYDPNLMQQEALSRMFLHGGVPTGGVELANYKQEDLNRQKSIDETKLQLNIDGKGLTLPNLSIQISQAQISMDRAQLDMSQLQQSYNVASFQEQQSIQNQQYGPIGADVSREGYFTFMRNQQAAGYDPTSPETGTKLPAVQTFGLQNAQFYAGIEHQRNEMVLGRSPLLSDMKFQEDQKYLNEQEAFYKEQLKLTNQQRSFDLEWQPKLLNAQAGILAIQEKQFALEQKKAHYEQLQYVIENSYLQRQLDTLQAIEVANGEKMAGQGPNGGQNFQPIDIVQQLATGGYSTPEQQDLLKQLGLTPDQINTMMPIIKNLQNNGGDLKKTEKQYNAATDKDFNAYLKKLIDQGGTLDQQKKAAQDDSALLSAGLGGSFTALKGTIDNLNDTMKSLNDTIGKSGLSAGIAGVGPVITTIGGLLMGVASILNILSVFKGMDIPALMKIVKGFGGKGATPALPDTGPVASVPDAATGTGASVVDATGADAVSAGMAGGVPTLVAMAAPLIGPVILALGAAGIFAMLAKQFYDYDIKGKKMDASQAQGGGAINDTTQNLGVGNIVTIGGKKYQFDGVNYHPLVQDKDPNAFQKMGDTALDSKGNQMNTWDALTKTGLTYYHQDSKSLTPAQIKQMQQDQQKRDLPTGTMASIPPPPHGIIASAIQTGGSGVNTTAESAHTAYLKRMNDSYDTYTKSLGITNKTYTQNLDSTHKTFADQSRQTQDDVKTTMSNSANTMSTTVQQTSATIAAQNLTWQGQLQKNLSDMITSIEKFFGYNPDDKKKKDTVPNTILDLFKNLFNNNPGGGGGLGPSGPGATHAGFETPPINADFHKKMNYGIHQGVDFAASQGTPLSEFVGGKVTGTGFYPWGGEVDVDIGGGLTERYLHLSRIGVVSGQSLTRGQRVGLTGGGTPQSGLGYWSSGAHSHVQYDKGNINHGIDPWLVWALMGDSNLAQYYGSSMQGSGVPTGSKITHLYEGGVALTRMQAEIAEKEPEAVIPLSKLSSVLQQTFNQTSSAAVAASTSSSSSMGNANTAKSALVQKLADKFEIHVHTTAATLDEHAQDELMNQTMDIIADALVKILGTTKGN